VNKSDVIAVTVIKQNRMIEVTLNEVGCDQNAFSATGLTVYWVVPKSDKAGDLLLSEWEIESGVA